MESPQVENGAYQCIHASLGVVMATVLCDMCGLWRTVLTSYQNPLLQGPKWVREGLEEENTKDKELRQILNLPFVFKVQEREGTMRPREFRFLLLFSTWVKLLWLKLWHQPWKRSLCIRREHRVDQIISERSQGGGGCKCMMVIKILFKYGNAMEICMWASQVELVVKNPPAHAGDIRDVSLIPGSGGSPGGGHGNPLWYPCLENPMDIGDWQAMICRVTKSRTWLSD